MMKSTIRNAISGDYSWLRRCDSHISEKTLLTKIANAKILIAEGDGYPIGFIRWNLFWDNTPFINLIFVEERFRNDGVGSGLVESLEKALKAEGYATILTSTQINENGKLFWEKAGYKRIGEFQSPGEDLEIILCKTLE